MENIINFACISLVEKIAQQFDDKLCHEKFQTKLINDQTFCVNLVIVENVETFEISTNADRQTLFSALS